MAERRDDIGYEAWSFSDEEETLAYTFSELQEKHIRTEIAVAAAEKIQLSFDPALGEDAKDKFLYANAYCLGKIEVLKYLLTLSDVHKSDLINQLSATHESQEQDRSI